MMFVTKPAPSEARPPSSGWRGRRLWLGVAVVLASWHAGHSAAQADAQETEYKVKAAYLYKFTNYVQWPPVALADADASLVIGVVGADKLGDELAQMVAERRPDTRPVRVRKLRHDEPATGLHMLFVGRAENPHVAQVLVGLRGKPVLTVTESDAGFNAGSIINFVIDDDKVRFDVAPRQSELANLKISARLMAVARKVAGGGS